MKTTSAFSANPGTPPNRITALPRVIVRATKDTIVAAGWPADSVLPGEAGTTDFPQTTVYYAFPEDEAAALGLAGVIGGAEVAQTDQYLQVDDPATEVDESAARQLTVVLGLDRVAVPSPSPTE